LKTKIALIALPLLYLVVDYETENIIDSDGFMVRSDPVRGPVSRAQSFI